ncbi:hypothetical protein [Cohnella abietis]|uniref:Uncharacterized protein n=1 Tax=Cohnella abietis TaxID=2507935 RepID=A0A3T1D9H8_9BACL|nr:hypothetical protein [Cohnella abietis]BBI34752.1 hypothetical protein KCTCHS21_41510 [Cohnella abietis]
MDMQPLQAKFATQDQAESAIRKLSSLRSDCFRLEKIGPYSGQIETTEADALQSIDGLTATALEGSISLGSPEAAFTLSASVPGLATDQARSVILQAGGEII